MPLSNSSRSNNAPSRKARMESMLRREIALCVQQELRDPRLGLVTIVRAEMTGDLHQVKAYYTVLGTATQRRLATQALEAARGFIQSRYAKSVQTRLLPILTFAYDDTEDRRHGMDDVIRRARATDSDAGTKPEPTIEVPLPGQVLPNKALPPKA